MPALFTQFLFECFIKTVIWEFSMLILDSRSLLVMFYKCIPLLHVCGLSFNFLDSLFWRMQCLNFWWRFCVISHIFNMKCKKSCPTKGHKIFNLFLSRSCTVSGCTLQFQLSCLYGAKNVSSLPFLNTDMLGKAVSC
jgi:hypothetical protein